MYMKLWWHVLNRKRHFFCNMGDVWLTSSTLVSMWFSSAPSDSGSIGARPVIWGAPARLFPVITLWFMTPFCREFWKKTLKTLQYRSILIYIIWTYQLKRKFSMHVIGHFLCTGRITVIYLKVKHRNPHKESCLVPVNRYLMFCL